MTTGAENKDTVLYEEDEELKRQRRAQRREQMRREKEKRERVNRLIRKGIIPTLGVLCVAVVVAFAIKLGHRDTASSLPENTVDKTEGLYMENQSSDSTEISEDDLKFINNADADTESEESVEASAMPFVAPAAVDGKIYGRK
jgi:hypothetical protein